MQLLSKSWGRCSVSLSCVICFIPLTSSTTRKPEHEKKIKNYAGSKTLQPGGVVIIATCVLIHTRLLVMNYLVSFIGSQTRHSGILAMAMQHTILLFQNKG
jgi:hypothetical protein